MKKRYRVFLALLVMFATGACLSKMSSHEMLSLQQLKWKHRIVVTTLVDNDAVNALAEQIKKNSDFFDERKLIVVVKVNDMLVEIKQNIMIEGNNKTQFLNRLQNNNTILIGLDGGTKATYPALNWQEIFADIDSMPMRRNEIERNIKDNK
ncbi:DUF4174 domain-containing protein [Aliiglaciecola sp. M165]|uniref:DUF4174 domain-containing protein n=1 Tax=Aliiglaciecola sp. M165 TaxID=2593649 RepID=UPI00117E8C6E|nr:DUF4174 domain-containing protein [Aliiglaciecola sp. M165]TRY32659.1 DUF4174 domain-containing protein [Aliiglaciecola sp. M165]